MKRTFTYLVLIAASLCIGVPVLHAELLNGQVVRALYFRGVQPDQTSIIADVQTVVSSGVELPAFVGFLRIDFSDTTIVITATQDAPVTSFELVRFNTIPVITNVMMNPATDYQGFDASRIHLAAGGQIIDVNLTGLRGLGGHHLSLDLQGLSVSPPPPSNSPSPVAIAGQDQSVTADVHLDTTRWSYRDTRQRPESQAELSGLHGHDRHGADVSTHGQQWNEHERPRDRPYHSENAAVQWGPAPRRSPAPSGGPDALHALHALPSTDS